MSGVQFPPAPWSRVGDGRYLVDADGDYVCDIKLDEDDPVVVATEHLIAAAPELYEALRECRIALIAIEDSAVEAGFDRLGDIIGERLTKANRAIDKADGAA